MGSPAMLEPPPRNPDRIQNAGRAKETTVFEPRESESRSEGGAVLAGDGDDEKRAATAHPRGETGSIITTQPHRNVMRQSGEAATGDNNGDDGTGGPGIVPVEDGRGEPPKSTFRSVMGTCRIIITHSWINVLLVFVPAGIAVEAIPGIHGAIVFALNCVAVIPLAGLLAFATESLASEMGDALGALINVTFGNIVELIIL